MLKMNCASSVLPLLVPPDAHQALKRLDPDQLQLSGDPALGGRSRISLELRLGASSSRRICRAWSCLEVPQQNEFVRMGAGAEIDIVHSPNPFSPSSGAHRSRDLIKARTITSLDAEWDFLD